MPYGLSPFGQLCFIQPPSPLYSQPTPPVRITALPPRDPRNPIWAESCCMNCAKLVGSADLFCVPSQSRGKCVRCFNLNLACEPVPDDQALNFRELQQCFQFYDLRSTFEACKIWFERLQIRFDTLRFALIENELRSMNRTLERLEKSFKPPVDADGKVNGESKGDMNEEALKRRPEIQIQRERVTELEGLIAQESAKHEMQTNKILK